MRTAFKYKDDEIGGFAVETTTGIKIVKNIMIYDGREVSFDIRKGINGESEKDYHLRIRNCEGKDYVVDWEKSDIIN